MALKDLGYDNVQIIFSDPKNSPQLLDEEGEPKSGTAYVDGKGVRTIIINAEDPKNSTRSGLIGTLTEEGSHVIGKVEGRQIATGTEEKGLESTGRATNEYFQDKYKDNDTAISIQSDGKDYSGVDFGENVGDKKIILFAAIDTPWISEKKAPNGKSGYQNVKEALQRENKVFEIDWYEYKNASLLNDFGITYTMKINYYYFQADKRVKNLNEYMNGRYEKVSDKESVFHNIIDNGRKIYVGDNPNKKYVEYDTGKEVVLSSNGEIVTDTWNIGTANRYTYRENEKISKLMHVTDVSDWIFFGTGVNDKSSRLQRMQILVIGSVVSNYYDDVKLWAKMNGHTSVGYNEIVKFLNHKHITNPFINNYYNLTNMNLNNFYNGLNILK